jgi:hypothetical protein
MLPELRDTLFGKNRKLTVNLNRTTQTLMQPTFHSQPQALQLEQVYLVLLFCRVLPSVPLPSLHLFRVFD